MPNNWINWVKSYAQQNGLSYACALSQPACKDGYRAKFGVSKKVPQKVERERMGLEDIATPKPPPPRRKPTQHSKEAFKMAGEDISSRLMRENIPYRPTKIQIPRISAKRPVVHYEDIYPDEAPIAAPPAAAKKGRKTKYATDEERAIAKRQQTLASNLKKTRERASEKKEGKKMGKEDYRF